MEENLSSKVWDNISGKFISSSSTNNDEIVGKWSLEKNLPEKWEMHFENIKFFASPTPFRHLGFFPISRLTGYGQPKKLNYINLIIFQKKHY